MSLKVKSVNCYVKEGKKPFICIVLETGDTIYVNTGLITYAVKNAKYIGGSKNAKEIKKAN